MRCLCFSGAMEVGKTTILQKLFPTMQYLSVNTDLVRDALNRYDPAVYRQIIKPKPAYVLIDEIHRLSDPGRTAKIIYDQMPLYRLIVTGSSAFDIKIRRRKALPDAKSSTGCSSTRKEREVKSAKCRKFIFLTSVCVTRSSEIFSR